MEAAHVTVAPKPTPEALSAALGALMPLAGADELELFAGGGVRRRRLLAADGTRFAESTLHEPEWCVARVWRSGRVGIAQATLGELTGAAVAPLVELARARAESGRPGSPPPTPSAAPTAPIRGDRTAPVEDALAAVERARSAIVALGAPVQTLLHTRYDEALALRSTTGRAAAWRRRREDLLVRLESPLGAIVDGAPLEDHAHAEVEALVRRLALALEALAVRGDAELPALPLLLRPAVAGPLVQGLAWLLGGRAALATPGLLKAVGKQLFPSCLTITDTPPAAGHDDEGTPLASIELVRNGKLSGFLGDHATAFALAAAGVSGARAGRARNDGVSESSPVPLGLALDPGTLTPPARYVELAGRVEGFSNMPRANLVTLRASGWLIEDGVRVRPIGPVDLDLPLLSTIRRLSAVGSDLARLPALGPISTPSLLVAAERPT